MANNTTKDAAYFVTNAFDTVLNAPVVSEENLHIIGGRITAAQLITFLKGWQADIDNGFAWAMIEDVDKFEVNKIHVPLDKLVNDVALLDRIRLFGDTGDLDVRRNRMQFHWRFVGDKTSVLPDLTPFSPADFWQSSPHISYREVTRCYYQWRGQDERVNARWATTTGLPLEGTYLHQKQYLDNGRIAFVRYVGFEENSA